MYDASGALGVDVAEAFDYRGQSRRVVSKQYSVTADHGRCSDMGKSLCRRSRHAHKLMQNALKLQGGKISEWFGVC